MLSFLWHVSSDAGVSRRLYEAKWWWYSGEREQVILSTVEREEDTWVREQRGLVVQWDYKEIEQ